MPRVLLAAVASALLIASACGGTPPQTAQLAPLPDDPKPASAAPAPSDAAAPTATPPAAPPEAAPQPPKHGPVEVKIPAQTTTVKLVAGGTGKKQPLRYAFKPGASQQLELVMDFTTRQDTDEKTVPTIVLAGEIHTVAVDGAGGADYALTVTTTDARPAANAQVPVDQFRSVLGVLAGMSINGKLGATGTAGEVTLRLDNAPADAGNALDLLRLLLPRVPILPNEPVGVGAKWQTTTITKLADKLDVTRITDYELTAHDATTWTITGKTTVSGKDQEIDGAKISAISGSGQLDAVIGGGIMPKLTSTLDTGFTATEQSQSAKFSIKVGSSITPKS